MRVVVIESPYKATEKYTVEDHVRYAHRCMLDCIYRKEIPLAGHLLYTQVLDDKIPADRNLGISFHCELIERADYVVVYRDLGISTGMAKGIQHARKCNKPIEYRWLTS